MPPCSPETDSRFQSRLRTALCLGQHDSTGIMLNAGTAGPIGTSLVKEGSRGCAHEQGSAVVEFTFLALLLLVPVVYFIITVGQIQGGAFAVVGAADQAAKVYVAQPDAASAHAAAEQAVAVALADFGHGPEQATLTTSCDPADCQAPGTAVTTTVNLTIPLPFIPFGDSFRLSATEVEASATQLVGRFR